MLPSQSRPFTVIFSDFSPSPPLIKMHSRVSSLNFHQNIIWLQEGNWGNYTEMNNVLAGLPHIPLFYSWKQSQPSVPVYLGKLGNPDAELTLDTVLLKAQCKCHQNQAVQTSGQSPLQKHQNSNAPACKAENHVPHHHTVLLLLNLPSCLNR